jgi:hypothetical protein
VCGCSAFWLAVKLGLLGAASVATAGILSYLLTWWPAPLDRINGDRWAPLAFAARDIVPLGYAAFAFVLGATLGLVFRRTLPAMALTLAAYIAVQILMPTLVRPHLLHSTTVTIAINRESTDDIHGLEIRGQSTDFSFRDLPMPDGAWVISAPPVQDSAGRAVRAKDHPECFPGLPHFGNGPDSDAPPGPDKTSDGGSRIGRSAAAWPGTTCTSRPLTSGPTTTGRCSGWRRRSTWRSPAPWPQSPSGGSGAGRTDPATRRGPDTTGVPGPRSFH